MTTSRAHPRQGVTLVELLVVLGLLLVLGTIGVSAFARSNRVNRMTATRDLIGDQLRQARATARASGRPVVLRVNCVRAPGGAITGGDIVGAVQATIAQRSFSLPLFDPQPSATNQCRTRQGADGQGFQFSADTSVPESDTPDKDEGTWEPRYRLRPKDGFHLEVSVFLNDPTPNEVRTLVLVRPEGAGPEDGEAAVAGLRLQAMATPIFFPGDEPQPWSPSSSLSQFVPPPSPGVDGPVDPVRLHWMLQGWVKLNGQRVLVSELAVPVPAEPAELQVESIPVVAGQATDPNARAVDGRDQAQLLLMHHGGPGWHRVGLLWDGQRVTLLREGRPVIRSVAHTGAVLADVGAAFTLGRARYPQAWAPGGSRPNDWPAVTTSQRLVAQQETIDEVVLDRLSTVAGHPLPGGVKPTGDATLYAWPDGSITTTPQRGTTNLTPITLRFTGVAEDEDSTTQFTIAPSSGSVTSGITLAGGTP